jgi:ATP-dependent DNA ligase
VLVWDTARGWCSSLLQRRLTASRRLPEIIRKHPAHLVAFDLLRDGHGVELLDQPLRTRRAKLHRLFRGAPPQLAVCPQTSDREVALSWLRDLGVTGVEGVVIKPISSPYRLGAKMWTKVRARDTAEYVIGGVTGSLERPVTLLLGRFDGHGILRYSNPRELHRMLAPTLGARLYPRRPWVCSPLTLGH